MLFEYAVEPKALASSWQNFRYLIEKFGFDRGRLIAQFPNSWVRDVYDASSEMKPVERARFEETLRRTRHAKVIPSRRGYDRSLGGWLPNALSQQAVAPFHAIISAQNVTNDTSVLIASDVDESHPLMIVQQTEDIARTGVALATAMRQLLVSAKVLMFVDRYFDLSDSRYQETLKACLDSVRATGGAPAR